MSINTKVKKNVLEKIIREELISFLGSILESNDEPRKLEKIDATKDKKSEKPADNPVKNQKNQDDKKLKAKELPDDSKVPEKKPDEKPEDIDAADKDAKENISDQLTGHRVGQIALNKKSQVLPGAQELALSFLDSPEPLRILVTKTGQIKFFYKGKLSNEV